MDTMTQWDPHEAPRRHPACLHSPDVWRLDDCMRCGSEVTYCPWCAFFICGACTEILPRPMPSEETYPYFPPGHLSEQQCWEIWTNYNRVWADDIAVSERLPLGTQQRLWPFQYRAIMLWFYRFGFNKTHVFDLGNFVNTTIQRRAREAADA
jgi:hypothetical protein